MNCQIVRVLQQSKGEGKIIRFRSWFFVYVLGLLFLSGCSSETVDSPTPTWIETPISTSVSTLTVEDAPTAVADIIKVSVSGESGDYRFSVTISSPDEGCDQYADWWEVIDERGELIFRRILHHSHVGEQPFTRSDEPVKIAPDDNVWVRAHMHPTGYGGAVMKGSVAQGFIGAELGLDFAPELAESPPLPEGCDF